MFYVLKISSIYRLHDGNGEDVYLAFNAHDYFVSVSLPSPPTKRKWFRVVSFSLSILLLLISVQLPYLKNIELL